MKLRLFVISFFAAAVPAMADIYSGGGSAAVGRMSNHGSVGSSFTTGNNLLGINENKSLLTCFVEMRGPAPFMAGGARLCSVMQDLEAEATTEGLWLRSVTDEDDASSGRFRVRAEAVGRGGMLTPLTPRGRVMQEKEKTVWMRSLLTEEYSVSADGVRQDFVVSERPVGEGPLRVLLDVDGAKVEAASYGAKLILTGNAREIAYSRLHVTDAGGRVLEAAMAVDAAGRMAVEVDDGGAIYPVRIDPTFADPDWVSIDVSKSVFAMAGDGSGNLYVAGMFQKIGDVVVNYIAKWNGDKWSSLGSGTTGDRVYSLAVIGNDLYAGGYFTSAGGITVNNVARWNGSNWSSLGGGLNGQVDALAVSGNDLYAGGAFTTAGGTPAKYIAKWNGSAWSPLGSGMNNNVYTLAVSEGQVYAGGRFTEAGGSAANYIAKWNGSSWSDLGGGFNDHVSALAVLNGKLFAGGTFTVAGGTPAKFIAKWNGSAWSTVGGELTGVGVSAFAVKGDNLFVGGNFYKAAGSPASSVASWNGKSWSQVGSGLGGIVAALQVYGDHLYAGGEFLTPGATKSQYLARISALVPQTISFATPADRDPTSPSFPISATASSALPVRFTLVSGPATVSGNTVTLTGTNGTVKIRASQEGNSTYAPATPVTRSFKVRRLSTVATLSKLVIKNAAISPAFSSKNTRYTAKAKSGTQTVKLNLTATHGAAILRINGVLAGFGSANIVRRLTAGKNIITITVTAESGAIKTYNLTVIRNASAPTRRDSNLAAVPAIRLHRAESDGKTLSSIEKVDGLNYLTLTYFKPVNPNQLAPSVEVSSNLLDWYSGQKHTTTLIDRPSLRKVRDNTPLTEGGKRFIRLNPGNR